MSKEGIGINEFPCYGCLRLSTCKKVCEFKYDKEKYLGHIIEGICPDCGNSLKFQFMHSSGNPLRSFQASFICDCCNKHLNMRLTFDYTFNPEKRKKKKVLFPHVYYISFIRYIHNKVTPQNKWRWSIYNDHPLYKKCQKQCGNDMW